MTEPHRNSRLAHVPSILAGSAALIAALSTVYVNLRDKPAPAPVAAVPATPAATAAPAAPEPAPKPQVVHLRLDRVQVDDDGSMGTTDWTFQVSVDSVPVFSVAMPSLSDQPGENLVRPAQEQQSTADVALPADRNVAIAASGWKKGWLGGAHGEVSGTGWIAAGLDQAAITLQGDKPKGPRFVLYFTAAPAR